MKNLIFIRKIRFIYTSKVIGMEVIFVGYNKLRKA